MKKLIGNENDVVSINKRLVIVNAVGCVLSLYAFYVGVSKKADSNYYAFCDISDSISCSKVFSSQYSTGFGIMRFFVDENSIFNQSNSLIGIIVYSVLLGLSYTDVEAAVQVQLGIAVLSNVASVYLGIILVILHDLCIVCALTYVVNAANLALAYQKVNLLKDKGGKKE